MNSDVEQIWEVLERNGIKVGAVSPMNAVNRLENPSFFIPDPWTPSPISADGRTQALYEAVRQAVGDNATGRLTAKSLYGLVIGFLQHVPMRRWRHYMHLARRAFKRPWLKAVVLDELLCDLFLNLLRRHRPQFATLFVNAGAHIQHHYLFNSAAYCGPRRNPNWYAPSEEDPVLEIYTAYDAFVGRLTRLDSSARVVIATGLQQVPYPQETYYWRLKHHRAFLTWAGVPFVSVDALMSRDFVLECTGAQEALSASNALTTARVKNQSSPVFEVDNRGSSLFCTLVFGQDIEQGRPIAINGRETDFSRQVAFVALKNAHHNGLGYLIDTSKSIAQERLPLISLFTRVSEHFGVNSAV